MKLVETETKTIGCKYLVRCNNTCYTEVTWDGNGFKTDDSCMDVYRQNVQQFWLIVEDGPKLKLITNYDYNRTYVIIHDDGTRTFSKITMQNQSYYFVINGHVRPLNSDYKVYNID